jgi:cyclophilin family peptidyl-prolyl cis-trans isomerase
MVGCGGSGGGGTETPNAPTVSAVSVSTPRYGDTLLITVSGTRLDLGLTVTAPGCSNLALSTTAPNVSTPTQAFYTCTVTATGNAVASVAFGGAALGSQTYVVPDPQVTLTLQGGVDGQVVLTLDPTRVPQTSDNFLRYVADGFYDGTTFHRVLAGFVAQGGGFLPPATPGAVPAARTPLRAPIALEVGRGLSNVAFSVAMARAAAADSATSQFFINLVDNSSSLDPGTANPGYAVFGAVSGDTSAVVALAGVACAPVPTFSECAPQPPVVIATARQTR